MKIIAIVGARPQFIKHFPFERACEDKIELITIHTGQHYDENMSDVFFNQLKMKKPNYMLNVGSGNHGVQTAKMMIEIEKIVELEKPEGMVVYGDTNSTLAGALVASKLHVPIFHIEAGLRSFNKKMPEEINRILTDHISKAMFVPSKIAVDNLRNEGIIENVYNVGDIMKDLVFFVKTNNLISNNGLNKNYYYVTIHRPYNTDHKERLLYVLNTLNNLNKKVIMSIHPRTSNLMSKYKIDERQFLNIEFILPQSYFENLSLLSFSEGLITDSGGMQKEAYWLKKRCVTIRKETEWLETLNYGANTLLFNNLKDIEQYLNASDVVWDNNLYGNGECSIEIVSYLNSILS